MVGLRARDAFEVWGRTSPAERAATLRAIADGVLARVPELAEVETRDNGSLLRSMRSSVMPRVARNFTAFADKLLTLDGSADTAVNGHDERISLRSLRWGTRVLYEVVERFAGT